MFSMNPTLKYFLIAIAVIGIAVCVWFMKTIFIYIAIAGVLSLFGEPLVKFYTKLKIGKKNTGRGIASVLSLFSMLFVLLAFMALFIPLIVQEASVISTVKAQDVMNSFQEPLRNIELTMSKYRINYGVDSFQTYIQTKLVSFLDFARLSTMANAIISTTGDLFIAVFAILFLTFFFLKDKPAIYSYLLLLSPPKHTNTIQEIMKDTKRLLTRYFIGIAIEAILVSTLIAIALSILGVKNALIIGLVAGIVNVIPYIGPLIGAGFAIIIAVSTNLNVDFYSAVLPMVFKMITVFAIVTGIDAFFFQPLIYSNTVKAHPLEIFLVILIAATLTGIAGMIVAVPVYTILRVIAKEFLFNFKIVQRLTKDLD